MNACVHARRWCEDLDVALARAGEVQVEMQRLHEGQRLAVLRGARVIGCTTTGAAMQKELLADVGPAVVMVEEAGELLEAHVLTSLSPRTQHLIMVRVTASVGALGGWVGGVRVTALVGAWMDGREGTWSGRGYIGGKAAGTALWGHAASRAAVGF